MRNYALNLLATRGATLDAFVATGMLLSRSSRCSLCCARNSPACCVSSLVLFSQR